MLAAELLLLMDLALENPLELEVRFPRPLGMSSNVVCGTLIGNCDGSATPDCDVRGAGLNLSRKDLLPEVGIWLLLGGAPYRELKPEVDILGPGRPDGIPLNPSFVASFRAGELLLRPEAIGIDLHGEGGTDGILGVPPLSCITYWSYTTSPVK
jgi:hypothetical protein